MKKIFHTVKTAIDNMGPDDVITYAAAVAFYSALSLAPILSLILTAAGFLGEDAQQQLIQQIQSMVGPKVSQSVQSVIDHVQSERMAATWSAVINIVALILSATAIFVQLRKGLNSIWDAPRPQVTVGFWIKKRLISLALIFGMGLIILASMLLSAVLEFILQDSGLIWRIINFIIPIFIYFLLFAVIFRYLPDIDIRWGEVWGGAAITAILFAIGKFAIGKYLGYTSVGSAFGAAGSLLVMLIWVFYSSIILFFGAEITQVTSKINTGNSTEEAPENG